MSVYIPAPYKEPFINKALRWFCLAGMCLGFAMVSISLLWIATAVYQVGLK